MNDHETPQFAFDPISAEQEAPSQFSIEVEQHGPTTWEFKTKRSIGPYSAAYFTSKSQARGSGLGEQLFEIDGIASILVENNRVKVWTTNERAFQDGRERIEDTIRNQLIQLIAKDAQVQRTLTGFDWFVCLVLPVWGIIAGLLRLVRGNPTAGTMLGVSTLSLIFWVVINIVRWNLLR